MAVGVRSSTVSQVNRVVGVVAAAMFAALLAPGVATADDPVVDTPAQHNVTYRARIDGLARGALITYRMSDTQVNTANPTMLPGRTFEATGVLTDPKQAGMRISIQWPYSASLNCEIRVDDETVAAASQFIGPRITPAKDDPDYGALICGAPLTNALGSPAPADPLPDPADDGTDPALLPPAPLPEPPLSEPPLPLPGLPDSAPMDSVPPPLN